MGSTGIAIVHVVELLDQSLAAARTAPRSAVTAPVERPL
jgi:hypothetical protein